MKRYPLSILILITALSTTGCSGDFFKKLFQKKSRTTQETSVPQNPRSVLPQNPLPGVPVPNTPPPVTPPPPTTPPPVQDSDAVLTEEMNRVIGCYNGSHKKISNTKIEYLYALRPIEAVCKTGQREFSNSPFGESPDPFGLFSAAQNSKLVPQSVSVCNQASANPLGLPTTLKMEGILKDYAAAYAELGTLAITAADYYKQKDYQDDQCAKGREMHPKLMGLFDRLGTLEKNLNLEIDVIKSGLDQRELANVEKTSGKNLNWHVLNFSIQAKNLLAAVTPDAVEKVDAARFTTVYPLFEKSYNDLSGYATAYTEEAQKGYYSLIDYRSKDYFVKAKLINRTLTGGQKPSNSDLNELINAYNGYVEENNRANGMPRF